MSGFEARPPAIRGLGMRFDDAAAEVDGQVGTFESRVRDVGEAFGWLGPSQDLYDAYQRSVGEACESLGAVAAMLADAADRLAATAANYEASDVAPAP